jgi:peptidoglycan-associated lipoprotein
MNRIVLVGLALAISHLGWSQAKELKEAYQDFGDLQYSTAAVKYQEAIDKITDEDQAQKNFATYMLAECYRMMNDYDRAEINYKPLIEGDFGNTNPVIYLRWANMLRTRGKVAEAKPYYQKYLKEDPRNASAKMGIKACDWLVTNEGRRARVNVSNVGALNSSADDFAPAFLGIGFEKMVLTSNRAGAIGKKPDQWGGALFSDLFVSNLSGGSWSDPGPFDHTGIINTDVHEGTATFNSDFSRVYFTRCIKWDEKKRFCEILVSEIGHDSIGTPKVIFSDTNANYGQPTLTRDELKIIFSSSMKDGEGGKDLYMATRNAKDAPFSKPVSIGSNINSFGNEMFPFLFNDTLLFFASDSYEGYGGLDIYRSFYRDNAWTKPENLLRPINSGYDDFGMIVRILGEEGYFTSNRPGGTGGDDIYQFTRRVLLFALSGKVKDNMTLLPIENASIYLINEKNDTIRTFTDGLGCFSFNDTRVLEENSYDLIFRKENYFSSKDSVTTKPFGDDHNFALDVLMEPIPEKPIVLPDILYPLDEWILLPQYQDSLRGLVVLLNENPSLVIELRSHTDSRASNEYNDMLSQKRAQSVIEFLITEGIDPGRMVAKGYGERVFRILDKDVKKEGYHFKRGAELNDKFIYALPTKEIQEAAFQLNRRTEFAVIAKDYKASHKTGSTTSPVIEMISDSSVVAVDFTFSPEGKMQVYCYLNDFSTQAIISSDSLLSSLDQRIVQDLLKKGAINRNDFTGKFEEIMVDGKIKENSLLNISKIRLGEIVISNVSVEVRSGLNGYLLIGKDMLDKFGEYTINSEKSQLIFK